VFKVISIWGGYRMRFLIETLVNCRVKVKTREQSFIISDYFGSLNEMLEGLYANEVLRL